MSKDRARVARTHRTGVCNHSGGRTRVSAARGRYLEVSADEQKVDLDVVLLLRQGEGRVDAVELAVTATLHGDLWQGTRARQD